MALIKNLYKTVRALALGMKLPKLFPMEGAVWRLATLLNKVILCLYCRLITYWPARSICISGAEIRDAQKFETRRNSRRASPVKCLYYCTGWPKSNVSKVRAYCFVGLQPTVIASRAPHLLLEQSVMTKIRRILDVHRPSIIARPLII